MTLNDDQLVALLDVAKEAAARAASHIAAHRPTKVEHKDGQASLASQVVTEVDRAAQRLVLDVLRPTLVTHDLGLLAEESVDDESRHHKAYFWCVDPLDGTLPFIRGDDGYAVSIALVSQSGTPELAVVLTPADGQVFAARRGHGATLNGAPLTTRRPASSSALQMYVDQSFDHDPLRERLIDGVDAIARELGYPRAEVVQGAGGVVNACQTITRAPGCYFKLPRTTVGGGSLWDFAATACLVTEAGGVATDNFGDPLELNRADSTFLGHRGILFASDTRLAALLRSRSAEWRALHPR